MPSRFTHITHGFSAGQLSETAQDNLTTGIREEGAAVLRNVRLLRDGGVEVRERFERLPNLEIDPVLYNALAEWELGGGAGLTNKSINQQGSGPLVPHPETGICPLGVEFEFQGGTDLKLLTLRLRGHQVPVVKRKVRAITFHGCRLTAGSHMSGSALSLYLHDGTKRTYAGADPFDWQALAPGKVSRDLTVALANGEVAEMSTLDIMLTSGVEDLKLKIDGVSLLRDLADDADPAPQDRGDTPIRLKRFGRLVSWRFRDRNLLLLLTPQRVWMVEKMARGWGPPLLSGTLQKSVWFFTERQLDELTTCQYADGLLLLHTDFPRPLRVYVKDGNPEIAPLELQNVPALPALYRVRAEAELVDAPEGLRLSQPDLLIPPLVRLLRVDGSDTSLAVEWSEVPGATAYEIVWTPSTGFVRSTFVDARPSTTAFAALPGTTKARDADDLKYRISGLTKETSYTVLVRAVNDSDPVNPDRSGWSEEVSLTTLIALAKPVPSVRRPVATQLAIALSWPAVAEATGYEWRYRERGGDWTEAAPVSSLSADLFGSGANAWEFAVRAVNSEDSGAVLRSEWSDTVTLAAVAAPAAPVITARRTGFDFPLLQVDWNAVANARAYLVQIDDGRIISGGPWFNAPAPNPVTGLSYRHRFGSQLVDRPPLRVRVRALGWGSVVGPWSNVVDLT